MVTELVTAVQLPEHAGGAMVTAVKPVVPLHPLEV
jgi:hypothetical protein